MLIKARKLRKFFKYLKTVITSLAEWIRKARSKTDINEIKIAVMSTLEKAKVCMFIIEFKKHESLLSNPAEEIDLAVLVVFIWASSLNSTNSWARIEIFDKYEKK